jgi:hypothetical protein
MRPYLEKLPSHKRAGGVTQGVGTEFKPQNHKKKMLLLLQEVSPAKSLTHICEKEISTEKHNYALQRTHQTANCCY